MMKFEHEQIAQQDRLIPNAVDRLAKATPNAEYGRWGIGQTVMTITYAQLANIVNGLTWWLLKEHGCGYDAPQREVLAYIGPNDVRYTALVLAAVKTGFVIFVTSPRNSQVAQKALFEALKCQTLISPDPASAAASAIVEAASPRRSLTAPSIEELLSQEHPSYLLQKTFDDVRQDPFVIMHTSGTTGLPKPIVWTNETCARVVHAKNQNAPRGNESVDGSLLNGKRIIVTLPPFHGALLAQLLVGSVPYGNVVIAPATPTAHGVVEALKHSPADVALLVPSVVVELAKSPELLEYCSRHLKAILYIGGDLPQDIGDRVAAKIYLRCQWGATETGILPQLLPPQLLSSGSPGLWRHVKFHPCSGAAFDEVMEGIFELVVRRDPALTESQACFTVPGIREEYRTRDLFERHPEYPDIWRWRARADDIIVFLNGEKTNPVSMEQHITAMNPTKVNGVMVIGAKRFQAALLVEPALQEVLSTAAQAALIEDIWPSVDEANQSAPAHARVEKSFILIVPRLVRSPKGTFRREPSIQLYTDEIQSLYDSADDVYDHQDGDGDGAGPPPLGRDAITQFVRRQVRAATGWASLKDCDDFFERGMDSLQGLQLTRAIRRSLHRSDFALSSIYQNPSILQLTAHILDETKATQENEAGLMQDLFKTYHQLVEQIPRTDATFPEQSKSSVLLTGSTGEVGTFLLHSLLKRPGIGRIYCLNRSESSEAMQREKFAIAGLDATSFSHRITFLSGKLDKPQLGLIAHTYDMLREEVGLIMHAAWPVNFNLSLAAFRPQLVGLVNLFAALGTNARLVFLSSVAAVGGHASPPPEEILHGFSSPSNLSYGRAKFLGELLVDAGAKHLGVPATIIRVGQAAGAAHHAGVWNPREWLPSMIISSFLLGQVPDSLGSFFDNIDFVPVDVLGDVLVDLAVQKPRQSGNEAMVFNLRNPNPTPWHSVLPAVIDAARASAIPMEAVSPRVWLAALRASGGEQPDQIARSPALKLLDFYEGLWADSKGGEVASQPQPMVIEQALKASPTLRGLEAVGSRWMRKWVMEWIEHRRNTEALSSRAREAGSTHVI